MQSDCKPTATLCVPAYNASRTIGETLESLLAQTYERKEVIVSDNHSTDDTCAVVRRYANRGVSLVTCPQAPVKTGSPLDNCLSAANNWNHLRSLGTGEFVGIFHADDVYEPTLVQRQVALFCAHPDCAAVFPTFRLIDEHGNLLVKEAPKDPDGEEWFDQLSLIKRMLRRGHNVSSSGPLLRRASWAKAGLLDGVRFEQAVDTEFWLRIAGAGKVAVITPPLVRYRRHPGQDSPNGYRLYRHKPLPIVTVLEHWTGQPGVRERLDKSDWIHLGASKCEEDLRVAINYTWDGRENEARRLLAADGMPGGLELAMLALDGRKLALARRVAGFALGMAPKVLTGRLARVIGRSRIGFPGWNREA
ncbi:MAG: glycosyltransferase [Myxococcales bacterium]